MAFVSMPASSLAALRSQIECDLRGRVNAPFNYRDRTLFDLVSTGIPEIDSLVGGLPRGALTEIYGPPYSGRTSLLLSTLASRTADGEVCALVDAQDSFDPQTAKAAGVTLKQLLWVRCQNIEQALRATDLLIQAGGFGLVAVDLSDVSPQTVRYVPLNAWFRFRRAVEDTPTMLMLLEQESNAKTCASLVLRLRAESAQWTKPEQTPEQTQDTNFLCHPFARLLKSIPVCTEVVRFRIQPPITVFPHNGSAAGNSSNRPGNFEASPMWTDFAETKGLQPK
jgi:recombination protein RecA